MTVHPVARPRISPQRSHGSAHARVRPRSSAPPAAASAASILVEVAVSGPDALETATRLAGRIRDLVDSANADSTGVDVSAAVGLQIGAGNTPHRPSRPTLSSVGTAPAGPVPLPAFVAPAPWPTDTPGAAASGASATGAPAPGARRAVQPLGAQPLGAQPLVAQPGTRTAPAVSPVGPAAQVPSAQVSAASATAVDRASDARPAAPLEIYPARRVALLDGAQLSLTRREFDLLLFLSEHAGRVFDRPQLLRLVWGHQVICGERTVDVHIRRLRSKVERTGPVISTVRGVGYRLDAPERVDVVHEGE